MIFHKTYYNCYAIYIGGDVGGGFTPPPPQPLIVRPKAQPEKG